MKTIVFFNNKGGVGKTSMAYHLAWMFRDLGRSVLAVDLDPQANLSSMFLDETELEELWPEGRHPDTILGAVEILIESLGDIQRPKPICIDSRLHLIAGDLGLHPCSRTVCRKPGASALAIIQRLRATDFA